MSYGMFLLLAPLTILSPGVVLILSNALGHGRVGAGHGSPADCRGSPSWASG
ncbi:MAG: hypothetical protein ACQZ2J_03260 [Pseudomonas piscis]|uniref:hypothetical protein n=1 Tax=Pseudomonas piscis TaxID=2614538 RepID=UPI003D2A8B90